MKFLIKDFFSKCDQLLSFGRIWSHLLKKPLRENLIFCAELDKVQILGLSVFSMELIVLVLGKCRLLCKKYAFYENKVSAWLFYIKQRN